MVDLAFADETTGKLCQFHASSAVANVWVGATCGHNGEAALLRVEALRGIPVAPGCQRFISAEPLLTDLSNINLEGVGWVIAGGESGAGNKIRPMYLDHAMNLYRRCKEQGAAFWLKQIGVKTVADGELLDLVSTLHDLYQVPDGYREMCVRERPEPAPMQVVPLKGLA